MDRLQVLIPPELDAELRQSSRRLGISTGEFVRRAIRKALTQLDPTGSARDPVSKLAALFAPTGDIDQMPAEVERSRTKPFLKVFVDSMSQVRDWPRFPCVAAFDSARATF
jgi:hypothetical protein